MVHCLNPKEIVDNWKFISNSLRTTYKLTDKELSYIFNNCMVGLMHVWLGYEDTEKVKPLYVLITVYQKEAGKDVKVLTIHYLFIVTDGELTIEQWKEDYQVLKKFAKQLKCKKLRVHTVGDVIYHLFTSVDTVIEQRVLEVEV